jgi:hypothetical protein
MPVDDANLYLAHLLGPGGAIAALTKSADTLLKDIPQLDSARSKNPQLNRLDTVADLKAWAESFMGKGMTAPLSKDSPQKLDVLLKFATPEEANVIREDRRSAESDQGRPGPKRAGRSDDRRSRQDQRGEGRRRRAQHRFGGDQEAHQRTAS